MNWSAGALVSKKADPPAVVDNGLTETVTQGAMACDDR